MIYVCLPAHDEGDSLGLVLWKIRKVFDEIGREYRVLVVDDGSIDHTALVLEQYGTVVPLTVIRHPERRGYSRSVEALFRRALELSDRPKRDCAILMHADYVHRPEHLADVVRRIESGADLVVAEGRLAASLPRTYRWARRFGALWLRRATALSTVRDPTSGFLGVRLSTVRGVLSDPGPVLESDRWAASAELVALAGAQARRVETISVDERHDLRVRPSRVVPWEMARSVLRARAQVKRARARALARGADRPDVREGGRQQRDGSEPAGVTPSGDRRPDRGRSKTGPRRPDRRRRHRR